MNSNQPDALIELYRQVAGLQVVKCRLSHERIETDVETSLPVRLFQAEASFVRFGFCSRQERKNRLGCGHTTARYVLEQAIRLLAGPVESVLQTELNELTDRIHALDHRKGDSEKQLARLIWEKHTGDASANIDQELAGASAQIEIIERSHSDCVERIDALRHRVLAHLNAAIAAGGRDPSPLVMRNRKDG